MVLQSRGLPMRDSGLSTVRSVKHALAALTTNCAEFRRAWRAGQARAGQASSRANDGLTGCWQGEWVSDVNGHRGPLCCVLVNQSNDRYRASFHARYATILRVCYSVDLEVTTEGSAKSLRGAADLGSLAGGRYEY